MALRGSLLLRCRDASRVFLRGASQASSEPLALSESCVKRLKEIRSRDPQIVRLRVTVEGGGCSGFQYKFDLESEGSETESEDTVFEKNGEKLVADSTSLEYIGGSTVDYHTELIRSGFRIISNPKADQGCSCGASFSVKIDL